MKIKLILASIIVFASILSNATEVKKGTLIGTVVQTESPERLKQFPITTLADHRKQLKPMEISDAKNPNIIDPRAVSWGFRLTYKGEIRSIPKNKKSFLDMISTTTGNSKFFDLYSNEALVSDGNEDFWLPLQNTFLSDFKTEIKKGDLFKAETRYFGNHFDGKPTQIFFMVEFAQIPKAP